MRPRVWLDTETQSLAPSRRAWEIAVIRWEPDGKETTETTREWFVDIDDLDLGNADPMALSIGRFYERHPQANGTQSRGRLGPGAKPALPERTVLLDVERLTRGAILVGSNPSFDAATLAPRMRACGILPSWHYRAECIATLAKGWLLGRGQPVPEGEKSEDLSRAVGVNPDDFDRHTALGDCQWSRAVFDAVHGTKATA